MTQRKAQPMTGPVVHEDNAASRMDVEPSELREIESAPDDFEGDLARVVGSADGGERIVYHDGAQFVAVLIDANAYESLCDEAAQ